MKIVFGVSQDAILGTLLFVIFLVDLVFIVNDTEIVSQANDNIMYKQ